MEIFISKLDLLRELDSGNKQLIEFLVKKLGYNQFVENYGRTIYRWEVSLKPATQEDFEYHHITHYIEIKEVV